METDDDLPEFFKVYIRHYTFQQMMFPIEFVEYMGRKKSGMAELVGSSGKIWQVELVYDGKDLYFAHGWQEFVKDNLVLDGDFLFFKYHGSLIFSVLLYDESMCEKELGLLVNEYCPRRNVIPEMEIKQEKYEVETAVRRSVRCSQPQVSKTLKHAAVTMRPSFEKPVSLSHFVIPKSFLLEHSLRYKSNEKMVLRTSRDSSWVVNIISNPPKTNLCGGWSAFTRENGIRDGNICKFELLDRLEMMVYFENGREGIQHKKLYVATSKQTSSKFEAKVSQPRVKCEGQKVATRTMPSYDNPSFILLMKKHNVGRSCKATFPKWFIQDNSLHYERNEKMILQTEKNSFGLPVNIIRESNGSYIFSGGWASFVRCNNIKIGNTCKFELVNRLEMKVHITRSPQNNAS